jgi:hypothetical protein
VRQILMASGVDDEIRAKRQAEKDQRRAEKEAAEEVARRKICRVCGREFRARGQGRRTVCSDDCHLIATEGRRYLDPERYERNRQLQAQHILRHPHNYSSSRIAWAKRMLEGGVPANRRFFIPDSAVVAALRRVGREDLIQPLVRKAT